PSLPRRDDADGVSLLTSRQSASHHSPLPAAVTTTTLPVDSHQSPLPFGNSIAVARQPHLLSVDRPSPSAPPFPQLPIDRPSLPSFFFTLPVIVDSTIRLEPQVLN
ncbi:hypothetical protein HAX54_014165, partial [Datura stramonium]|nr:hypothetical protein [Datura stramonium]